MFTLLLHLFLYLFLVLLAAKAQLENHHLGEMHPDEYNPLSVCVLQQTRSATTIIPFIKTVCNALLFWRNHCSRCVLLQTKGLSCFRSSCRWR